LGKLTKSVYQNFIRYLYHILISYNNMLIVGLNKELMKKDPASNLAPFYTILTYFFEFIFVVNLKLIFSFFFFTIFLLLSLIFLEVYHFFILKIHLLRVNIKFIYFYTNSILNLQFFM
jgi:hypothetical protein